MTEGKKYFICGFLLLQYPQYRRRSSVAYVMRMTTPHRPRVIQFVVASHRESVLEALGQP